MTTASDAPDSAEITVQDDLAVRKSLGPYELKRKLGQGGMGAVYLAVDPTKKEQLALKILPREKASNPQLVKRFKAEAQNAAQLTHENIVSVFGTGEAEGYLYIALEFVDGIDVHDLIQKRGVLPVKRSIDIIKQVSRALQHALEQHIVHRDIKPANLLIRRDGVVKLADMGLARAVDETTETGITRAGTTVGTVDYMAPEQARNSKSADVRSDIYSLGCTWYHMLTGRPPFADGSLTNKLHAHAKQPPPDPRGINPNVPEGVVAVMNRMMAKNPDDRYQTPKELIKDLEGALINKDAVSRKILEGIVEYDTDSDHDSSESSEHSTETGDRLYGRHVIDSTVDDAPDREPETVDEYSVRSRPAEHNLEDDTSDESNYDSTPSKRQLGKPKPGPSHSKGSTPPRGLHHAKDDDDQVEEDPHSTLVPGKSSMGGGKSVVPHKAAYESNTSNDVSNRNKPIPAKQSGKGQKSEPQGHSQGPSHNTLPPPKRRSEKEENVGPAVAIAPKKLAAVVGSIAVGMLLLLILFPYIKKTLMGEEPVVVGTNPFEGSAPPPPVGVQPAAAPPVADVPDAPGAPQTVKDLLIDRKDQLANGGTTGPGPKPGANPGVTLVGPDPQDAARVEWMDQSLQTTSAPIFSIRKGQIVESERQYPLLQDAIKKVTRDGGRLVLFNEGPFELAPMELNGGVVSIEAAVGIRPRIRLIKDSENNKPPGIVISGGSLLLDGVDIVCDADSVPADAPWTWFHVNGGHVYVKRSSLTLTGQRKGATTAIKLSGKPNEASANSRFLLDESVVRGEGFQAVQLESPTLDAVIRNSLVIAGETSAVTLRHSQKSPPESTRKLRLVDSTISSRQQALTLCSIDVATPIPTEVSLKGVLVAAPENASTSVFLFMDQWSSTKPRIGNTGPFKNLVWNAQGSAAMGFNSLVTSNADPSLNVNNGDSWKTLWKDSTEMGTGMVISSINWPTAPKGPLSQSELKLWSPKTLESLPVVFSTSDHIPGCRISNLRAPDLSTTQQAVAEQGQRPRVPTSFPAKLIQQVDLNKTDLGKLITSKTWDDGTVFVASGSGTRTSSPIVVEGRKIRIQFNQSEGPTLILNPKAGIRSGENSAFITVRGGQLDVEQGSFAFDSKDAPSITPWFINVEGGGFSLKNCRIIAPLATAARNKGLIRWIASPGATNAKQDGEFTAFGMVENSLLVGNGTLLELDFNNTAFVARNSAFVSRQNLFEITNLASSETSSTGSAFDAQECTYLATGTQFVVQKGAATMEKVPPIRIFHQDCVFATLQVDATKSQPLMMNVVGASSAGSDLMWSEVGCGYSTELKAFHHASPTINSGPLPSQDFTREWVNRWGKNRIERPLRENDGVIFEKNLSATSLQVKPENLALYKTAKARTWSETRGPIGVRPEALEPPAGPLRPATGTKKPIANPKGGNAKPGLKL